MRNNNIRMKILLAAYDENFIEKLAEQPLAYKTVSEILSEYNF